MVIKLNGNDYYFKDDRTVKEILELRGINKVAVEVNDIRIEDFSQVLKDGDVVEYLAYMAGGKDGLSKLDD